MGEDLPLPAENPQGQCFSNLDLFNSYPGILLKMQTLIQ